MIHRTIIHINKRLVRGTGTCHVEIGVRLGKVSLDANLFQREKVDRIRDTGWVVRLGVY